MTRGSGPRRRDVAATASGAVTVAVGVAGAAWMLARRATSRDAGSRALTVVDADGECRTVTLPKTRESVADGWYGIRSADGPGRAHLGGVVRSTRRTVTRRIVDEVGVPLRAGDTVVWNGWYFADPADAGLDAEDVVVETPVGPAPAWLIGGDDGARWVIHVHGRGAERGECLRGARVCRDAGLTSLVVSYRNDAEAPSSADCRYGLGAEEWRDVDAAVSYARAHGAREIILWGWSMGGAVVLQEWASSAAARDLVTGLILESPVIDWRTTLRHQARARWAPRPVTDLALRMISTRWGAGLTGQQVPISLDDLDFVRRADIIDVPVLLLCSVADDVVPPGPAEAFARRLPHLVTLARHPTAQHTRLWNADPTWWEACVAEWLARNGYEAARADT